jgi:hypothetical protein
MSIRDSYYRLCKTPNIVAQALLCNISGRRVGTINVSCSDGTCAVSGMKMHYAYIAFRPQKTQPVCKLNGHEDLRVLRLTKVPVHIVIRHRWISDTQFQMSLLL